MSVQGRERVVTTLSKWEKVLYLLYFLFKSMSGFYTLKCRNFLDNSPHSHKMKQLNFSFGKVEILGFIAFYIVKSFFYVFMFELFWMSNKLWLLFILTNNIHNRCHSNPIQEKFLFQSVPLQTNIPKYFISVKLSRAPH